MDFNAVDQAVAEKARAQGIDQEVSKRLDLIASYGEDPFPTGTVLRFTKLLGNATRTIREYQYAAIKVGRRWYTTGPSQGKYTWDELVLFLVSGPDPTTPEEVTVYDTPGTNLRIARRLAMAMAPLGSILSDAPAEPRDETSRWVPTKAGRPKMKTGDDTLPPPPWVDPAEGPF